MKIYHCPVLAIDRLATDIYLMRLGAPELAQQVRAGQFVNIKVGDTLIPLLRKPFSVCRADPENGWVEVLWEVVGTGTRLLAQYRRGDRVNVLGPLGRPFDLAVTAERALLVAGGLGVAPFPILCEELLAADKRVEVFFGARTAEALVMVNVFRERGVDVFTATEDGSAGWKGLVTEPLERRLGAEANRENLHLFSCGPIGFLKRMIEIMEAYRVEGQVSIETMMACGFGICVGCAVRARTPDNAVRYRLACVEGPAFNARSIVFDD